MFKFEKVLVRLDKLLYRLDTASGWTQWQVRLDTVPEHVKGKGSYIHLGLELSEVSLAFKLDYYNDQLY